MSDSRVAVVTGGNRGLGLETSRQLAKLGYRVVLTARKQAEAEQAAQRLGANVVAAQLDVTDAASVTRFTQQLRVDFGSVRALVNNAGISMQGFDVNVVRGTLGTNFFGALRVTEALTPLIADGGAITMVSSGMGELSAYSPALRARFLDDALTLDGLRELLAEFERGVAAGNHHALGWPSSAYRVSKAALNALTRILAKSTPRLRINSVCPGWVRTDMGGPSASREVEVGARGLVWAATLPPDGPTGGFFRDSKPISW